MQQIKNNFPNLKFNITSLIYLTGAITVIFKFPSFIHDRVLSILGILVSVTFLFCAYQNKKTAVDKLIENSIIKWIFTVCIFSACLWYSKQKLNFDYDIEVEYLNYSAYGYAFALAIPLCLSIYGLCIFIHVYLGSISLYQSFYAAIIAIPLYYLLKDLTQKVHGVDFILVIVLIISLPHALIIFSKSIKKANQNPIILFKKRTLSINSIKLTFKTWVMKNLTNTNNYLKITDLLSIALALVYVGTFSIGIIPEYQRSFLLLDAYHKTDCNDKKDSFLYLRKSDSECYKITMDNFEITKIESFHSPH